jgi:hypothetical protein
LLLLLLQAEKIFNQLHALGKEVTRIEPKKLQLHAKFCHQQLPSVSAALPHVAVGGWGFGCCLHAWFSSLSGVSVGSCRSA